jgi:hypothetical protein
VSISARGLPLLRGRLLDLVYEVEVEDAVLHRLFVEVYKDSLIAGRHGLLPEDLAERHTLEPLLGREPVVERAVVRSLGEGRFVVELPGGKHRDRTEPARAISAVVGHFNRRTAAVSVAAGRPVLHAGAVSLEGSVVVLAGVSMVGKTTTTIALGRSGFEFHSDDILTVDEQGRLHGSRKPVGFRAPSSVPLEFEDHHLPPLPAGIGSFASRPIAATDLGLRYGTPSPVRLVVFPRLEGESGAVTPMSRALGLQRLVTHSFTKPSLADGGFGLLADVARGAEFIEWVRGPISDLAATLREMLAGS